MQPSNIIKIGADILKRQAEDVTNFNSKDLYDLIEHLFYNLEYYSGAGIAAPQIGVNKRVVVYGFEKNPRYSKMAPIKKTVLINPVINFFSEDQENFYEGCLSVPNLRGEVSRPVSIKVTARDVKGDVVELSAAGFEARIIQHEVDHLNGLLFPMRMTDLSTLIYSSN